MSEKHVPTHYAESPIIGALCKAVKPSNYPLITTSTKDYVDCVQCKHIMEQGVGETMQSQVETLQAELLAALINVRAYSEKESKARQIASHTEEAGEVCTSDCLACNDPIEALIVDLKETRRFLTFERMSNRGAIEYSIELENKIEKPQQQSQVEQGEAETDCASTSPAATREVELQGCPLAHRVSAGLRVSKIDPRVTCLDCGLILMATDWTTLYERWNTRAYRTPLPEDDQESGETNE